MAIMVPLIPATGADTAIPAAIGWIEGLLLGTVGSVIAILAVAGVGFAMLQGRLDVRDGLRVVLGCFILFGAPVIANGLVGLVQQSSGPRASAEFPIPAYPPPPLPAPPPTNPDPYAGAAVPMRVP